MRQLIFLLTSLMFMNTDAFFGFNFTIETGFGNKNNYKKQKPIMIYEKNVEPQITDVSVIKNAISRDPIDFDTLIDVLAKSNRYNREEIRKGAFMDLRNRLYGSFEKAVSTYLLSPNVVHAQEVHAAIFGFGADESVLIDLLCLPSTPDSLEGIIVVYAVFYQQYIETHIKENIAGNFQKLLLRCANSPRTKPFAVFYDTGIERDAQRIIDSASSTNIFNNEMITMLGEYSFRRIQDIVKKCDEITGQHDFLKNLLVKTPADDFQTAALRIITYAVNPEKYYALRFDFELTEADVDHESILRLIILDKNIDMKKIADVYEQHTGKNLENVIGSRINDERCRQLILAIFRARISNPALSSDMIYLL